MTNKGGAKQHGAHLWPQRAPKSTLSKRANKERARAKRAANPILDVMSTPAKDLAA